MHEGVIIGLISGFYYVRADEKIYECRARGVFRKNGETPRVGDRVEFTPLSEKEGVVDKILPRKNLLLRPPIANIDKLFIVSSFSSPAPVPYIIDGVCAVCEHAGIEPVIVFNKCDEGDFSKIAEVYQSCGFRVYIVSARERVGIEPLSCELAGCVSAFSGNTGVGKSSLLNLLCDLQKPLETAAVSDKLGRGRHTTRTVSLYPVPGGLVADTPGFSSFDIIKSGEITRNDLASCFREFLPHLGGCRFSSCTHTGEEGCAVEAAANNGFIPQSRYDSYKKLYSELSKVNEWEKQNKA